MKIVFTQIESAILGATVKTASWVDHRVDQLWEGNSVETRDGNGTPGPRLEGFATTGEALRELEIISNFGLGTEKHTSAWMLLKWNHRDHTRWNDLVPLAVQLRPGH